MALNLEIVSSLEPMQAASGLALSAFSTLDEFRSELLRLIGASNPGRSVHVTLKPPVHPSLSIPLAFKTLVEVIQTYHAEQLAFKVHVEDEEAIDYLYKYLPIEDRPSKSVRYGSAHVTVMLGDIVSVPADAIVNASGGGLRLGGGVSGAIRDAAHVGLQQELHRLAAIRNLAPGDVVVTPSFGISSTRYIFHAATTSAKEEVVRLGIQNVLKECKARELSSVAFPALATGVGGLPVDVCARLFRDELAICLAGTDSTLKEVYLVLWTKGAFDAFVKVFDTVDQMRTGNKRSGGGD